MTPDASNPPDDAEPGPYRPIDCGVHDRLEAFATLRQLCHIVVRDGPEAESDAPGESETRGEREITARIDDVFAEGGEEFIRLPDGERIRLDRIVSVRRA